MMKLDVDVAVLGSSFSGSLTALVLNRLGRTVAVVDRDAHPRFAIGESSTPIANAVLRDLARRYDLPRLEPLSRYGTWKAAYPEVGVGLKRGFAYFQHQRGRAFDARPDHAGELLVTASAGDAIGDTQWLRADVDALLAGHVRREQIPLVERAETHAIRRDARWQIQLDTPGGPVTLTAAFLVDASGAGGALARHAGIRNRHEQLRTQSRAIYSHFRGVPLWRDRLAAAGAAVGDHPFHCDHAALHQLLDGAWMWMLRFDDGLLSAGLAIDARRFPLDESVPPELEWRRWLEPYPSLDELFAAAEIVSPPGRLVRTGRLQRYRDPVAGPGWMLLPGTAGFIDPLHSTGIAHSMCGIERLARAFRSWGSPRFDVAIRQCAAMTARELRFVDLLVAGCYAALGDARLVESMAMLYFAAATACEHQRNQSGGEVELALLAADDPTLFDIAEQALPRVAHARRTGRVAEFESFIRESIRPYNRAGLCDPAARGMYRRTAAPS